jgi:Domain of unknown function (DUF4253)
MADQTTSQIDQLLHSYSLDTPVLLSLADTPERMQYFVTDGQRAIDCWHAFHAITKQTRLWPVILGNETAFGHLVEGLDRYRRAVSVKSILDTAVTINAKAWLQEALHQNDVEDEPWDTTEGEFALRSEWLSDISPATTFSLPYDWQTQMPYPRVMIGFVPTTQSWQIPAYLRFGSYNACPSPAEHVSVLRRWEQQYDAEVVGVTHDVIELRVGRPPTDRDRALALAYEQYAYCPDIVDQGVETLDALAATLLSGSVWWFWWD